MTVLNEHVTFWDDKKKRKSVAKKFKLAEKGNPLRKSRRTFANFKLPKVSLSILRPFDPLKAIKTTERSFRGQRTMSAQAQQLMHI